MAYLALYRKLRPGSFSEVIGQEHITKTLINQIKSDRIGHAYLFTGTRGVGKTSVARLFARAVCCTDPQNGLPCGKCEACRGSYEASPDITELDAASNNGVDNVRDIRDGVVYPPVSGKRKVYIIDEVHMLSGAAFNALLKTLEEPPEYVVFILCTTEAHKLPQTIVSRCMRFDFRLVRTQALIDLLKRVFKEQNKDCEESALYLIAENARGSVRDALSLAERCLTVSEGKLTYADAADALGAGDVLSLRELVSAILKNDAGQAVICLEKQLSEGRNPAVLARETGKYFRNLIVASEVKNPNSVLNLPESLLQPILEDAELAGTERLLRCAETFTSLEGDMRYSLSPQLMIESAVVRCASDKTEDLSGKVALLEKRLTALENALSSGNIALFKAESPSGSKTVTEPFGNGSFSDFTQKDVEHAWAKLTASARKKGGMLFDAVTKVTKTEKVGRKLVIEAEPVVYELIKGDKGLTDAFSALMAENFGDALWEIRQSDVQTQGEVIQKLKDLTDGKLKIEK